MKGLQTAKEKPEKLEITYVDESLLRVVPVI